MARCRGCEGCGVRPGWWPWARSGRCCFRWGPECWREWSCWWRHIPGFPAPPPCGRWAWRRAKRGWWLPATRRWSWRKAVGRWGLQRWWCVWTDWPGEGWWWWWGAGEDLYKLLRDTKGGHLWVLKYLSTLKYKKGLLKPIYRNLSGPRSVRWWPPGPPWTWRPTADLWWQGPKQQTGRWPGPMSWRQLPRNKPPPPQKMMSLLAMMKIS